MLGAITFSILMNISHLRLFSKLTRDYIAAFDSSPIKDFFPLSPDQRSNEMEELFEWRAKKASTKESKKNRKILIETLRRQHANSGTLTRRVEGNLMSLESERCFAVVTGQQVGIFGGPLYTIYKALHTIILATELTRKYSDYLFVPIFWQETEDHDFEETSSVTIVTSNFELRDITYIPEIDITRRQVGSVKFEKDALERVFSEIESFIPKTDFTDDVLSLYKASYQDDFTFAEAQAQLLGELLCEDGLLILDANTYELKSQASYLFKKEIETTPDLSQHIQKIGRELEKSGYHSQLDSQGLNLFMVEKGRRHKLSKNETDFSYNDRLLTDSEIHTILIEHPERFSMNVVMRPLVQDTILPTVAYIAGPSEVAYFAQLRPAYDWAGINMPMIIPRIGMTIVEDRFEKLLQKYNITTSEFLEKGAEIVETILKTEQEKILSDSFSDVNKKIDLALESLRDVISTTDATLDSALTSLKGKILTNLKDFESKSLAAERKKVSAMRQQFEKARNILLPNNVLQERELNLLYFLNKYGLDFWKKLKEKLYTNPPSIHEHTIVNMSEILGS
jgi:bacillithiol biosynthesis cysteine-adding enzyme BshC